MFFVCSTALLIHGAAWLVLRGANDDVITSAGDSAKNKHGVAEPPTLEVLEQKRGIKACDISSVEQLKRLLDEDPSALMVADKQGRLLLHRLVVGRAEFDA
jgi:hypothetical protein